MALYCCRVKLSQDWGSLNRNAFITQFILPLFISDGLMWGDLIQRKSHSCRAFSVRCRFQECFYSAVYRMGVIPTWKFKSAFFFFFALTICLQILSVKLNFKHWSDMTSRYLVIRSLVLCSLVVKIMIEHKIMSYLLEYSFVLHLYTSDQLNDRQERTVF